MGLGAARRQGHVACSSNGTEYDVERRDALTDHPGNCGGDASDCAVYVLRSPDVRGKFHPEKAKKLGVSLPATLERRRLLFCVRGAVSPGVSSPSGSSREAIESVV